MQTNPDPITGTPGAHPVGVGVGALYTAAAGATVGGIAGGPVGAAAGLAVGAVVGGLAGKAAAEAINPSVETVYWRGTHHTMPYVLVDMGYEEFEPAYRYGWESYDNFGRTGTTFDSIEQDLERGWQKAKGTSKLAWHQAKEATRHAWNRVRHPMHGQAAQSNK